MLTKILAVDDEHDMLKMLDVRLENSGYIVMNASSGEECVDKAIAEKPDLILLDVLLSGQSGFTVCKTLKENDKTKDIPVILVTALIGETAREHGLECGAEYVISKPFDPNDLLREIEEALKKRHNTAQCAVEK